MSQINTDNMMVKVGDTLNYETGRTYNFKQVLECKVVDVSRCSIASDPEYTVKVHDRSRHMTFFVQVYDFLGQDILRLYDSDQYDLTWSIARHVNSISLNGLEYLLDENGKTLTFDSIKSAETHLIDNGVSQSVIDDAILIKEYYKDE